MSVTRTKLEAGRYELTTPAATYLAVKTDQGWAVQLDGDEIETLDRLKDCEAYIEQADEQADAVCWEIENNPNSKVHRTEDGKTTACSIEVPQDGRSLAAEPTRGKCGVCYR